MVLTPSFRAHAIVAFLSPAFLTTGVVRAQTPVPYNRSVSASSVSYAASPDGVGFVISGTTMIASAPDSVRDLSSVVTFKVNGVVVGGGGGGGGGGTDIKVTFGPGIPDPIGGPANCLYFCRDNCPNTNWCGPINPGMCMCISNDFVLPPGGVGIPVSAHVASLALSDVIQLSVAAAPSVVGANPLPEIDPTDDAVIVRVVDIPACQTVFADLGRQGAEPGADGQLDNNDFIVFINDFFTANPLADMGVQGGIPGSDGTFDNNDFVVYIDLFFSGC